MTQVDIGVAELKAALPKTSGPVDLKGLGGAAEIYRDSYGIPHARAQSTWDAFFAQGFATAQDRLWHMDYDRLRAYGRWAKFAGPQGVEQDRMMRRFRLEASARADCLAVNDQTREMLDAYSAGVNAFIGSTPELPVEYRIVGGAPDPWQAWDCLAVFKVRHILMGVFEAKLWRARLIKHLGLERAARLYPGYEPGQLLIVPSGATYDGPVEDGLEELGRSVEALNHLGEIEAGSNSWAVSGSLTASGKPLVAGDPHRALEVPNVYYQNQLACPEFDVVGLSFPGVPGFPHFGHNSHVAWCVTHANADYQDLFIERFQEGDPTLYESKGKVLSAEVYHETITVRGEDPVEMDVTVTHHGPIIAGDPAKGYGIALRYTATAGPNSWADSLLTMLRSTSAGELEESMRDWMDPANNFVFADVHGDIRYLTRGQIPVRSRANAWVPVPGWTGEHEWQGVVPFEEMPRSRNPGAGYIVTANNRIIDQDYPHYIALEYNLGNRARRITDRLLAFTSEDNATPEDMGSIHADRTSIPAKSYVGLLPKVHPLDDLSARAKDRLLAWDGSMEPDWVAPTIYSAFRDSLVREVMAHALGPLAGEAMEGVGRGAPQHLALLRGRFPTMVQEDDRSLLSEGADWYSTMARALGNAVDRLRRELGQDMDSWRWGRVHRTQPRHTLSPSFPRLAEILDPPSYPMGGDGDTPHAASYSMAQPCLVTSASVARYVFDLSDRSNSAWVVPLGASGHPGSPHYADQAPIWSEVRLIPILCDWDLIAASAESHQALEPARG